MKCFGRPLNAFFLAFSLLLLGIPSAWAGGTLRQGSNAWGGSGGEYFPCRSLDVTLQVESHFARAQEAYVFHNPSHAEYEGVFVAEVPDGAVLTDFAYYFKGERIAARLFEKAKAEEIYRSVVRRGRDPALMQKVGKNLYRAQIFPIDGSSDVRVEVAYVVPLGQEGRDAALDYPLALMKRAGKVGRLSLLAEVRESRPDTGLSLRWLQRAGTVREAAGISRVDLRLDGFTPSGLARLRYRHPGSPAGLDCVAAPGPGGIGFFALRALSVKRVRQARLQVSGATADRTYPTHPMDLPPGLPMLLVGRYRGSGLVRLRLGPLATACRFPATAKEPSLRTPPASLWAYSHFQDLAVRAAACGKRDKPSEASRLRGLCVQLSHRFNVLSPYTVFFAIPPSEYSVYLRQKEEEARAPLREFNYRVSLVREARVEPFWAGRGDPLIRVDAPADARAVVALFPDQSPLPLAYDAASRRWMGRFDIPAATPAGPYRVAVVIVHSDGRRERLCLAYHVVDRAPDGRVAGARVDGAGDSRVLHLEVEAADAARAIALPAWGGRHELVRDGTTGFLTTSIPLPEGVQPGEYAVEIILLGRGHTRRTLSMEVAVP